MKKSSRCYLTCLILINLTTGYSQLKSQAASPPNIVFIISDDHSYQEVGLMAAKLLKLLT